MALDRRTGELRGAGGAAVHLSPALAALAEIFIASPGEVVLHERLAAALGYRGAGGQVLRQAVWRLRRLLPGEISAVCRYGYRWTPPEEPR